MSKTTDAIQSTKISGNFGPKLNGSVRSYRKSFEKTGPPYEVDHFCRSDRLGFWLNGSRPLTTLHVHHAFLCISLQSLYIYAWTRARALLFSSNPKSLLLSNCWAPWNNHEKKWKDMKYIFQRRFHGRGCCQLVRSLIWSLDECLLKAISSLLFTGELIQWTCCNKSSQNAVQNRDVLKRGSVKTHTTLNSFLYHSEVGRGSLESP